MPLSAHHFRKLFYLCRAAVKVALHIKTVKVFRDVFHCNRCANLHIDRCANIDAVKIRMYKFCDKRRCRCNGRKSEIFGNIINCVSDFVEKASRLAFYAVTVGVEQKVERDARL